MKILALDASTTALSVALLDTEVPEAAREFFEIAPRAHARRLLPAAHALLADAGWSLGVIEGLAFGRGPGAFTGLRIAAGLTQGLASGCGCPVAPISTLAALAAPVLRVSGVQRVQVVQDARMGEVYTATFEQRDGEPCCVAPERVLAPADLVIERGSAVGRAGDGWPLVDALHDVSDETGVVDVVAPHALEIARLAAFVFARGEGVVAEHALPVYVRDDVARRRGDRPSAG